jgi:hypothetical protein
MKNLIRASVVAMAFFLLAGLGFARGKADFDKFLKAATDNVTNYSSEKFYEKLEFTNKKTGEKKKFSDFEEVDRLTFILMQCDTLSHQLEDLYNKWKEELKNAEETPDDANEASKKDVTEYMEKLLELRKTNAVKVEKMVNDLFSKFPDKFTKEEKDYVLKTLKEYHDKDNLIKRK